MDACGTSLPALDGTGFQALMPPSAMSIEPVVKLDISEARISTALAISSGLFSALHIPVGEDEFRPLLEHQPRRRAAEGPRAAGDYGAPRPQADP